MERDGRRFYHAAQNGVQVTIQELLTSRIFYSIIFRLALERETTHKEKPLHLFSCEDTGAANTQASSFVRLL